MHIAERIRFSSSALAFAILRTPRPCFHGQALPQNLHGPSAGLRLRLLQGSRQVEGLLLELAQDTVSSLGERGRFSPILVYQAGPLQSSLVTYNEDLRHGLTSLNQLKLLPIEATIFMRALVRQYQ